jgi:hypothetical protein
MDNFGHKFRWGISADDEKFDSSIPFYEIPLTRSPSAKVACSLSSHLWHSKTQDSAVLWEQDSLLIEASRNLGAEACVINIPPALSKSEMIGERIQRLIERFKKTTDIPVYFDFGKSGLLEAVDSIDLSYCVFDPLWERQWDTRWRRRAALSPYWKVHGWHPERWVRMYPEEDLQKVLDLSDRFKSQFLIFGHSQRRMQYRQLSKNKR